jgi:hypothetical protein
MTHAEALDFLSSHQPMPGDDLITHEEADRFIEVLKLLEAKPMADAVPLLIGTVSASTGLGMYEYIRFVLAALPAAEVAPHLIRALRHADADVRCRMSEWCSQCPSQALVGPLLQQLTIEQDEDVRFAINTALEACARHGL